MFEHMEKTKASIVIDYRGLFEGLPGLYLILQPNNPYFTIVEASDAYLKATMTKRDEIVGKNLFDVFPDNPDDIAADGSSNLLKSLRQVITTKEMHTMALQKYDIQRPLAEGGGFEVRYWNPINTPLKSNNQITYIIHQVHDVTELVKSNERGLEAAEMVKEKLEEKLEEKIRLVNDNEARISHILNVLLKYTMLDFSDQIETTDKGDELDAIAVGLNTLGEELKSYVNQIEENQKQLELANKELESFSYSISHDLRAPLRAIHGYTKILEEDHYEKLDAEGKKTISAVLRNSKRMGELIDDLLSFSRLGKKELSTSLTDMNMLVKDVCSEIIPYELLSKINLNIKTLRPAYIDHALIRQVWTNLISNAVKFTAKNDLVEIEIGSKQSGDMNEYYIRDNGVGFDMLYADKLFGVFQRLHSQEDFEGTGVGLAIVNRIIIKHRGSIWVDSKLNIGTTVYFTLP